MNKKPKSSWNTGTLIAVGVAIGAGLFAATGEPFWIGAGIGVGAALSLGKRKG
jgi:L-asparagine transporter-like permease|tara:strand:+ start:166 stop:324 length:159 start_codon:yes stop_codon:yes gene_type:complete